MTGRLLAVCTSIAAAATLVYLAALALTPDPDAPREPRTWHTSTLAPDNP